MEVTKLNGRIEYISVPISMYLCNNVSIYLSTYWYCIVLHGFQDTYQYNLTLCDLFFSSTNCNANWSADRDLEIPALPLASLPSPLR